VDLSNGNYSVAATMGDNDFAHDNMIVKANGVTLLPDVDTAVGAFAVNTFNVSISGGSLSLEFSDGGGSDPTWVVNGLSITPISTPPPASCDRAQFIADVTVPDGTLFVPNAVFTKTWRLKNVGTCTWSTSYQLIFDTGTKMGGPDAVNLPINVSPGQTVDLTINLTAPNAGGSYRGYWKFKNANGVPFGIGADGTKSWWVDIRVSGATATPVTSTPGTPYPTATPQAGTMYDFAANVCSGVWYSGVGQLHCPGTDGDAKGFVLRVANPQLENGTVDSRQGLVTFPQNINNGYIQGIFPPYRVKPGDRFRSIVNCAFGSTSCYVVFRLDYQTGTSPITTFWAFVEKYDGQYYQADLDLSPLVGQDIKFILTVLSAGSPAGDRALWVAPIIYNASYVPTVAATAPATATPTLPSTSTVVPATATPTVPVTSTPTPTTAPASTNTTNPGGSVVISNFSFQPPNLQVSVGTTVTWMNNDTTQHTVTSDTNAFDSGVLDPGGMFTFTFNQAGTFAYHCNIHTFMKGTITVVP
jgi:plastocyanin